MIGLWVLVSFGGVMFDSANASLWTTSLMWSLLTLLLAMPALVMINHASTTAERSAKAKKKAAQEKTEAATPEEKPFVQESGENRTLWPESDEQEWQSPTHR